MEKNNFRTKQYEEYSIPKDWNTPILCKNMNEIINCASCGRKIKFGSCYTSLKIHNSNGIGYPVCFNCSSKEWRERELWNKNSF